MTEATTPDSLRLLSVQGLLAKGMALPVDLTVLAGQVWMVMGESGVGKSQLLKALADLIPHEGQVAFSEQSQQAICPAVWRSKVMYFAAETAWWLDSMGEHFESLPDDTVLSSLGLTSTVLQKHPDECSSGEKQRLALLRGLALKPRILLLDEITANLDINTAEKVERLLQNYLKESALEQATPSAIIWVSHDLAQRQRMAPVEQHLLLKNRV